jgi:uncharacterized membrane protein
MNRDIGGLILLLVTGIMLIAIGIYNIITGTSGQVFGIFGTVSVVDWIGWVVLPAGIVICIMSIIGLRRGPEKYTDEEAVRSKEALDRILYFEEHGTWPKTEPKKDD